MSKAEELIGALLRVEQELAKSLGSITTPDLIALRRRVVFDGPIKIIDDEIAKRLSSRRSAVTCIRCGRVTVGTPCPCLESP